MAIVLNSSLIVGNGASGVLVPGQVSNCTLTLINPSASSITIQGAPVPFATSGGGPWAGVIFSQVTPNGTGNQSGGGAGAGAGATTGPVIAAGGQITFSFSVILTSPQGNAETVLAAANAANQPFTIGVNVVTTDSNTYSPAVTVTPQMLGAVNPAAALTAPGQFNFSNPGNSGNWIL